MLFSQHAQQLTTDIAGIQSRIDELEEQLKALRNGKAQREAELQQVLTLEGAAESALAQTQAFINAAESLNRPDLIDTFWTALDALYNRPTAQLPEAAPDVESSTEPSEPTPPDSKAVDVEVVPKLAHLVDEDLELTDAEVQEIWDKEFSEPNVIDVVAVTSSTNGKHPASVGSAAFSPSQASLDELKRYVRSHWEDEKIRRYGILTRRSTWEQAAKRLLNFDN